MARADALNLLLRDGMSMSEMALRFILNNKDAHTSVPGMRRTAARRCELGGQRSRAALRSFTRSCASIGGSGSRREVDPVEWSHEEYDW